jgi:glycosyltransferase involved in cell wall biosynthesis
MTGSITGESLPEGSALNEIATPRVSVVVPNFRHVDFLVPRLESILGQTMRDFEVILLDDASDDGSVEILEKYLGDSRVRHLLVNEVNSGRPFAQWKRGLELARADQIWIAESDDVAHPEFLERLLPAFEEPNTVISACEVEFIDPRGESLGFPHEGLGGHHTGIDFLRRSLSYRNCLRNASAVLFSRTAAMNCIDRVEGFRYSGDWLFWALLAMTPGARIHYEESALCHYRVHPGSVHGSLDRQGHARCTKCGERLQVISEILVDPSVAGFSVRSFRCFASLNSEARFWLCGTRRSSRWVRRLVLARAAHLGFPFVLIGVLIKTAVARALRRVRHGVGGRRPASTVGRGSSR